MNKKIIKKIVTHFSEEGFSIVKYPLVSPSFLNQFYSEWFDFFENHEKNFLSGLKKPDGYYHYWNENHLFQGIGIPQQSFYFNAHTNLKDYPDLQEKTQFLFKEMSQFTQNLLSHIVLELSLDVQDAFKTIGKYETSLRIIYSPVFPNKQEEYLRNRAHEDIDLLTILLPATQKGLQYYINNQWTTIDYNDGDIILNPGDALQLLSNGQLKSPTHRVMALNHEDAMKKRLSLAYFLSLG